MYELLLLLLLLLYFALIRTFLCRSFDHDNHTFVVHYDTYNSDATLSLDAVLPLGKYIYRGHTFCTIKINEDSWTEALSVYKVLQRTVVLEYPEQIKLDLKITALVISFITISEFHINLIFTQWTLP